MKYLVDYEVWAGADDPEPTFVYRSQRDIVTDVIRPDELTLPIAKRVAADKIAEQILIAPGQYVFITNIRPL